MPYQRWGDTFSLFASGNGGTIYLNRFGTGDYIEAEGRLTVLGKSTGNVVGVFQGTVAQAAHLMDWQNSSAVVLSYISATGAGVFASVTCSDCTATTVPYLDSAKKLTSSA